MMCRHHQHDDGFIQVMNFYVRLVANAGNQNVKRSLAAKGRLNRVQQLQQKVNHIHTLSCNQSEVQGQLKPAAGKDQTGQGAQ